MTFLRNRIGALRWVLRHLPGDRDGDFSLERFVAVHDADPADQLGNLVSRTVTLVERAGGDVPVPHAREVSELERALVATRSRSASTHSIASRLTTPPTR